MDILVAGFIGSNLVLKLLESKEPLNIVGLDNLNNYYDPSLKEYRLGEIQKKADKAPQHTYKFIKGDLADKALIDNLFKENHFDIVVNLAKDGARGYLEAARDALGALDADGWNAAAIDAALEPLPDALGTNKRKFYGAVRVAECGNQVSPPLGESLELLGRDVALARLEKALPLAK